MEIFKKIVLAIVETSIWEWLAVLSSLIYVVLISYKQISAWFFAIISSALYIFLCFNGKLYLESLLNGFFLIMGIYGWILWSKEKTEKGDLIIKWSKKTHLINIGISLITVIVVGFIFDTFTDQANPYTDSFTAIFSLVATFMVTKRVLENWIYWIIIDSVSVYLFASRELYMTSVLFLLYTGIAIFGYFKWKKQFNQHFEECDSL
jgi:nicotinamide mononucleotide transporter